MSFINSMSPNSRVKLTHRAVCAGQAQLIDLLVCKGAPVNATDYHALTPLHLACQRGYQGVTVKTHKLTHTLLQHSICLCVYA